MVARHSLELAVPGLAVGALAGAMAGGLTLFAGQPGGAALLALPLALFGGLYGMLLGHGPFRPGTFAPAGLLWLLAFPLSRLAQESVAPTGGMADGVLPFLAYQAMVSLGFAIGFLWLHERLMPYWLLRVRARRRNPRADELLAHYVRRASV
ncbi:hypothetical protein GCM10010404_09680 [Nonomuraea africana]|uniref:Uncharacterized protein n=1 Tax=Nonomuraea africana TaxID=46171 RepID=A0ABR9KJU3_9ACTN|nr:hypothetical protein [Nonomuraea africana]MBE1562289.1 hypothetical protein [Nonomuraea africana]